MNKLLYVFLCASISFAAAAQTKKPVIRPQYLRPPTKQTEPQQAPEKKSWTDFYLNFGSHTEYYNEVQTDDSGALRKFDFSPTVGAGLKFPWRDSLVFLPEVNWVLPRKLNNLIKNLFMLRGDIGHSPVDWFRLRLGTSLMWLNQHGTGGKKDMNNGSGQSTFYYPDENRSSLNNTLDVGAEFLFDQFAVRLQTYTYSVFREERRQISYTLFATYYWDSRP